MKRLLRWMFTGTCLLSLLACLGTAWLWWRTRQVVVDEATIHVGADCVEVTSCSTDSRIGLDEFLGVFLYHGVPTVYPDGFRSYADATDWIENGPWVDHDRTQVEGRRFGVRYFEWSWEVVTLPDKTRVLRNSDQPGRITASRFITTVWVSVTGVEVTHVEAVGLFAGAPLFWVMPRVRRRLILRRRRRFGRCLRCGYDLTGNVSGRCPECGDMPKLTEAT